MSDFLPTANLGLAWSAYLLMTASPGPSNMAIMGIAMSTGRRDALVFASGVICGSFFWGLTAALGLSAVLLRYAQAMDTLKFLGGLYLLWLALKSARSAWRPSRAAGATTTSDSPQLRLYLRGLALHLTNPKAILSWLSVVAVGLPSAALPAAALAVVGSCLALGAIVFGGYAIAFSMPAARRMYMAMRRSIESIFALVFCYAGLRLIISRIGSAT